MALSIKTDEADRLARELCRVTGESLTRAVTIALRERLDRERARRADDGTVSERLAKLVGRLQQHYDTRPVTREEWDEAAGEQR